MTTMPTREQIERAAPLDMNTTRSERQANITIEGTLDGLTVTVEFTSAISAIPAAIERLKAIGLSSAPRSMAPATSPAAPQRTKTAKVVPEYAPDGSPLCPKHHKPLKEGNYGLYCPAKDDTTERGYCGLKFAE